MNLTLDQLSSLYSITTKLIAIALILIITPIMLQQFAEKRLLMIKFAMLTMAGMTLICVIPVIYYQYLHLIGQDNHHLLPLTTFANSTSLLTTAGAMYIIYKGGNK